MIETTGNQLEVFVFQGIVVPGTGTSPMRSTGTSSPKRHYQVPVLLHGHTCHTRTVLIQYPGAPSITGTGTTAHSPTQHTARVPGILHKVTCTPTYYFVFQYSPENRTRNSYILTWGSGTKFTTRSNIFCVPGTRYTPTLPYNRSYHSPMDTYQVVYYQKTASRYLFRFIIIPVVFNTVTEIGQSWYQFAKKQNWKLLGPGTELSTWRTWSFMIPLLSVYCSIFQSKTSMYKPM